MLEQFFVMHCAPTLAGLKSANLFSVNFRKLKEIENWVEKSNQLLNEKGVRIKILQIVKKRALIYVYRYKKVNEDINKKGVISYLKEMGYPCETLEQMLDELVKRLVFHKSFPHEIGLFIGYPLEDVIAFIENRGQKSACTGCWKAYSNEENAQKQFALYQKCTKVYCEKIKEGMSIHRLTVAV